MTHSHVFQWRTRMNHWSVGGDAETLPENHLRTYFEKCQELLKVRRWHSCLGSRTCTWHCDASRQDDGIMVIHTIGFCRSGQWNHGGWMNTYIFPGAELPTMSLGWEKGWLFCYWTCQMLNHILSCTERTCVAHWGHTSRNSSRICWKSLDLMSCCGGRVGFLVQGWVTVKMLARVLQDDWLKILTLTDWSLGFPSAPKAWRYWWVFISYVHTYTRSTVRFMAMCYCRWFFQEQWHLEDWQSFGVSYAKTLRAWKDNLNNWQGLEEFDQSFRRMWVLLSAISNARQVHVVLGCGATHHHTITPSYHMLQMEYCFQSLKIIA